LFEKYHGARTKKKKKKKDVTTSTRRGGMALYVVKRDGREEPVAFDKITARIKKLSYGLSQEFCDPVRATASDDDDIFIIIIRSLCNGAQKIQKSLRICQPRARPGRRRGRAKGGDLFEVNISSSFSPSSAGGFARERPPRPCGGQIDRWSF
jgi:hypothetical protein